MISTGDVTRYLARLGVPAEPPSAEALRRLHRAHVERIPYETFWIHLAEGWGIGSSASVHRLATTPRGGYCFQLNGAFARVLDAMGYDVSLNVAAVHDASGPAAAALGNHVALLVSGLPTEANPGGRWYADTGLGDVLHEPLPLRAGRYRQGPHQFDLSEVGAGGVGDWHLSPDETCSLAGVSILDRPVGLRTFSARHRYNSSSPRSGFARTVTAQLRHADGTTVLRGCVLTGTRSGIVRTHTCERRAEWLDLLAEEFGLVLDAPDTALAALWTSVRRTHEAWAATQTSDLTATGAQALVAA